MSVDLNVDTALPGFAVTLTCAAGFNDPQEDQVVQWHKRSTTFCLLVRELHEDGRVHFHSLVCAPKLKNACGIQRKLATLYKQMDLPVVTRVSIRVDTETDRVGWMHYLLKDKNVIYLTGWKMSWIKAQCLANVKKIPHKMLTKNVKVLTKATATQTILAYASASGAVLTGKCSLCRVMVNMMKEGYIFSSVPLKHIFAEVMAQSGEVEKAYNMLMGELHFIDD